MQRESQKVGPRKGPCWSERASRRTRSTTASPALIGSSSRKNTAWCQLAATWTTPSSWRSGSARLARVAASSSSSSNQHTTAFHVPPSATLSKLAQRER
eukprot:1028757-Prorocentrum_minimum.AAC.1